MKEASVEKDLPDSGHKEVSTQLVLSARIDIDIIQLWDFRICTFAKLNGVLTQIFLLFLSYILIFYLYFVTSHEAGGGGEGLHHGTSAHLGHFSWLQRSSFCASSLSEYTIHNTTQEYTEYIMQRSLLRIHPDALQRDSRILSSKNRQDAAATS